MRKNRQFTRKNANFIENQLQMNEKRICKLTKQKGNCGKRKDQFKNIKL